MLWLKLMHGAPSNPKWAMVATKAGCLQGHVWTLYSWALDYAGQHAGSLRGFDLEEVAATTGIALGELRSIWEVFLAKAVIVGEELHNWAKHQGQAAIAAAAAAAEAANTAAQPVVRAVSESYHRVKAHRARKRQRQGELFSADISAAAQAAARPRSRPASAPLQADSVTLQRGVTTASPPTPPSRDIYPESPPGVPPTGGRADAGSQNPLEGSNPHGATVQGEILLPMAGGAAAYGITEADLAAARGRHRRRGPYPGGFQFDIEAVVAQGMMLGRRLRERREQERREREGRYGAAAA